MADHERFLSDTVIDLLDFIEKLGVRAAIHERMNEIAGIDYVENYCFRWKEQLCDETQY